MLKTPVRHSFRHLGDANAGLGAAGFFARTGGKGGRSRGFRHLYALARLKWQALLFQTGSGTAFIAGPWFAPIFAKRAEPCPAGRNVIQ
ncbi:MAG TPA: hypothetical protein IAB50_09920 [Candidatus Faecivicinus avistercoris]|nr:hypothetical protein [Candidatus Faecivicinus avistercoris]